MRRRDVIFSVPNDVDVHYKPLAAEIFASRQHHHNHHLQSLAVVVAADPLQQSFAHVELEIERLRASHSALPLSPRPASSPATMLSPHHNDHHHHLHDQQSLSEPSDVMNDYIKVQEEAIHLLRAQVASLQRETNKSGGSNRHGLGRRSSSSRQWLAMLARQRNQRLRNAAWSKWNRWVARMRHRRVRRADDRMLMRSVFGAWGVAARGRAAGRMARKCQAAIADRDDAVVAMHACESRVMELVSHMNMLQGQADLAQALMREISLAEGMRAHVMHNLVGGGGGGGAKHHHHSPHVGILNGASVASPMALRV